MELFITGEIRFAVPDDGVTSEDIEDYGRENYDFGQLYDFDVTYSRTDENGYAVCLIEGYFQSDEETGAAAVLNADFGDLPPDFKWEIFVE